MLRALVCMVAAASGTLACRPEVPAQYVEHQRLAQDAAIKGNHSEAAKHWQLASQYADLEHVRDEAIYRQATSLKRAGRVGEADAILRQLAKAPGSRQERAAYDLATQALFATPSDGGKQLELTLVEFPGSGVARGAMDRWLRLLPPQERLNVLARLSAKISEPTLSERILLQQARTLEALGRLPEALEGYSKLISAYPYPAGQYWDEALLHKASIQAHLGDKKGAMATLQSMLSQREIATIAGTYERRYAIATLVLAHLSAPEDWQEAHALLREFPNVHPTSRELDDALWAAALLARDHGDTTRACEDIARLRQVDASSRYAACGALVCPEPSGALPSESRCNDYIANNRATFDAVILRAAAPYYSFTRE